MTLSSYNLETNLVVSIEGRLDATNSTVAENYLLNAVNEGHVQIVLELSKLEYISSIGLRTFLLIAKKVAGKGFVKLAGLQPQVFDVFHLSGFDTIFQILNKPQDA
jgi:anti-sigma B factor antagonist